MNASEVNHCALKTPVSFFCEIVPAGKRKRKTHMPFPLKQPVIWSANFFSSFIPLSYKTVTFSGMQKRLLLLGKAAICSAGVAVVGYGLLKQQRDEFERLVEKELEKLENPPKVALSAQAGAAGIQPPSHEK